MTIIYRLSNEEVQQAKRLIKNYTVLTFDLTLLSVRWLLLGNLPEYPVISSSNNGEDRNRRGGDYPLSGL